MLNREARARKFAFQILGTGCKYHLATESKGERERWVKGLDALLYGPPQPGIVCKDLMCIIICTCTTSMYVHTHMHSFEEENMLWRSFVLVYASAEKTMYMLVCDMNVPMLLVLGQLHVATITCSY